VFEAGLFGGALGIRRTFILHAHGSKLPSDLLGLTSVRYDPAATAAEVRAINQKLRQAIETEGRRGPVEGLWWQLSLTARSEFEPSAVSLLRIERDRDGAGRRTGPCRPATGARPPRSAGIQPASSTSGRASAPGTRRPRSSRDPERSAWRAPIAPPGTGRRGRNANPGSAPEPPASTFAPTPPISRCWRAGARRSGRSSSRSASGSGEPPRTPSEP
jgi:CAP12/Pycsar effector protein, TIR domain